MRDSEGYNCDCGALFAFKHGLVAHQVQKHERSLWVRSKLRGVRFEVPHSGPREEAR